MLRSGTVFPAAYSPDMPDEEILRRLLTLNLERARHKAA
jgi:hypothetical protein